MSSAAEAATVADLLKHLGDIPPARIRLRPAPGTATEQDVIEAAARTDRLCELWDGVLVEKPMGFFESRLAVILIYFLDDFLARSDLGFVLGEAGMLCIRPGQVRIPDVSYFAWKHFPDRILPPGAFLERTPDLAVEILSPGNTEGEIARKRREYFQGGTKLVWEVDPATRTVCVYTSPKRRTTLSDRDALRGGTVLPGFESPIRQWFARAGRRPSR